VCSGFPKRSCAKGTFAAAHSSAIRIAAFPEPAVPLRIISLLLGEETTMRWKISPHGHDARQIDLLAIAALLIIIVSALLYFDRRPQPTDTASFIVPSQSVHW
jgi:hypothetical protein